jgi:hypothetical protein
MGLLLLWAICAGLNLLKGGPAQRTEVRKLKLCHFGIQLPENSINFLLAQ